MMTKTDYIEGTLIQLDLWGEHFAHLEDRVSRSETGRGEGLREELAVLQRRRRTLGRQLLEASRGTTPGWEGQLHSLEDELDEFRTRAMEVHDGILEV